MSEFLLFAHFFAYLLEHKVLHRLESNKQESLYNKNVIELACSVCIGKKLVSSLTNIFPIRTSRYFNNYYRYIYFAITKAQEVRAGGYGK